MYAFFDIETAREANDSSYELGITCGALVTPDEEFLFHGDRSQMYAPEMNYRNVVDMVDTLKRVSSKYTIVTWNGVSFDFRVISTMIRSWGYDDSEIKELTLNSVDPAFNMFCELGYMCSLKSAAEGMNVEGKLDGMNGLEAVYAWKNSVEDQERVLRYVLEDCRALRRVITRALEKKMIMWVTRNNKLKTWTLNMGKVKDSFNIALPDTSWMTNPRTRESIAGWLF